MSKAIAQMFLDMMLKELPPEAREFLAPDNLQRVAVGIQNTIEKAKADFQAFQTEQAVQRDQLNTMAQQLTAMQILLEEVHGRNNSGGGGRARALPKPDTGSLTGDDNGSLRIVG